MKQIQCLELKEKLEKKKITLIDVREEYEREICSISGSINLPMDTIVNRVNELKKDVEYAVICHSGIRSLHVCKYLNNLGFSVVNVSGGIDMWATVCDHSMARY